MAIDFHAHYIPQALADRLRERRQAPCILSIAGGSEQLVMPVGVLRFSAQYVDLSSRLALMDETGVTRQLLSLPGLFGIDSLPVAEAAPLTRLFNDDLAAQCRQYPGRFAGLAALPLADMAMSVAELERARRELGLIGAILPVDAFESLAHAQAIRPLFEAGHALGAHFFIHPGRRPGAAPPHGQTTDSEMARRALTVQAEVGSAMVTLLLTDFLEPYGNVSVHVANLGGTFPAVVERMDHTSAIRTPDAPLPSTRTHKVSVDCASLGARAIEQAVGVFGIQRVLLGTDCPIFDTRRTLAAIGQARLSQEQRESILHRNAQALLARF